MFIYLTGYGSIPGMGSFGHLKAGDLELVTVEREWLDNKPGVSCVPEGVYRLERHSSQKKWIGETWALVNHDLGVYHFADPKAIRTAILIHIANHQGQLQGCIGVGSQFGCVGAYEALTWGVWNSTKSMEKLSDVLDVEGTHYIVIRRAA